MDSEIDVIVTICKQLVELQKREDAKPEIDKELGSDATDSLEEAIESLERIVALDDPTPQNLWEININNYFNYIDKINENN